MPSSTNDQIRLYLKQYLGFPHAPGFSVLISGPWGSGKTHLIKTLLSESYSEGDKHDVYVSLYGLRNRDEFDAALLHASMPFLDWKPFQVIGGIGHAVLKMFKFDINDAKLRQAFENFDARVYVFDDLERCEIGLNSVLGYINEFIEHRSCKVIIAANEETLLKVDGYSSWKEKIVGKSFGVVPDFDSAFDHFAQQISDEAAAATIQSRKSQLESIFDQSISKNLRALKTTMWDLETLYKAIDDGFRGNDAAMSAVMRLVAALSLEFKLGNISAEELGKREGIRYMAAFKTEEASKNKLFVASKRYPDLNFADQVLSSDVVAQLLVSGLVNSDEVNTCLKGSEFFQTVDGEPAWKTVWWSLMRDEQDVLKAIEVLENHFAKRELIIPGEIAHMFGSRIWLSDNGFIKQTKPELVDEGKKYIDDLLKEGWNHYR